MLSYHREIPGTDIDTCHSRAFHCVNTYFNKFDTMSILRRIKKWVKGADPEATTYILLKYGSLNLHEMDFFTISNLLNDLPKSVVETVYNKMNGAEFLSFDPVLGLTMIAGSNKGKKVSELLIKELVRYHNVDI